MMKRRERRRLNNIFNMRVGGSPKIYVAESVMVVWIGV